MHVFKKTFKNARANTHASSSPIFNLKIKTVIFCQVIIFNFRFKKANYTSVYKVYMHVCGFFFYNLPNTIIGYRMKSPNDTPKSCYSLMLKCWEENPTKRGNFEEIVKKLQTIVQKTK